jgi:D-alanine-D-alanine ligase
MTDGQTMRRQLANLGRIAVLAGGSSAERAISLNSGRAVHQALRDLGVLAEIVDPAETGMDKLTGFQAAWVVLHGRGGEDGVIQGVLEHLGVPYCGSGVMASALGMDKVRTKWIWRGAGLPTPAFYVAGRETIELTYPVIVKPAREGSSIGMCKVDSAGELQEAVAAARAYDDEVIVEQWVSGSEYTVAILDGHALPAIRLETPNRFYDFEAKYESESTEYHCPCGLSADEEAQLARLALDAFAALGGHGWGRVDLMRDDAGRFQLLEVNTIPGMTDHSLVPMAAQAAGVNFDELVGRILMTAMEGRP